MESLIRKESLITKPVCAGCLKRDEHIQLLTKTPPPGLVEEIRSLYHRIRDRSLELKFIEVREKQGAYQAYVAVLSGIDKVLEKFE